MSELIIKFFPFIMRNEQVLSQVVL